LAARCSGAADGRTGLATNTLAGLNQSVFQGTGEPLPPDFAAFPTFGAHHYLAWLVAGLIFCT
jgi:cytochrome b561